MPTTPTMSASMLAALNDVISLTRRQKIFNLSTHPRPESVLVRFWTTQATVAIVEILKDQPDLRRLAVVDVRFPIFSPKDTEHAFVLGSPAKPLAQNTEFIVRISAPATHTGPFADPKMAVIERKFKTLSRRAVINIEEIEVRTDGDPAGTGELTWVFGIYDAIRGDRLGPTKTFSDGDAGDGKRIPVRMQFTAAPAADELALFVFCFDSDPFPGLGLVGTRLADTLPAEATCGSNDDAEWTELLFKFSLPDTPGESFQRFTRVSSIWGGVSFFVTFSVTSTVPVQVQERPGALQTKAFHVQTGADGAGRIVGASGKDGDHFAVVAGDHVLYRRLRPGVEDLKRGGWHTLDAVNSPHVAISVSDGRVHLFTLDEEGAVRQRSWAEDDGPAAVGEWKSLGGRMRGNLRAVAANGTIALFATDRDGALRMRTLGGGGAGRRWVDLRAPFDGVLEALADREGAVHLLLTSREGELVHSRASQDPAPDSAAWSRVDVAAGSSVRGALDNDGGFVLLAMDGSERLRLRRWGKGQWVPDGGRWEPAGTIDAALNGRAGKLTQNGATKQNADPSGGAARPRPARTVTGSARKRR
jgi:hypothetical protein